MMAVAAPNTKLSIFNLLNKNFRPGVLLVKFNPAAVKPFYNSKVVVFQHACLDKNVLRRLNQITQVATVLILPIKNSPEIYRAADGFFRALNYFQGVFFILPVFLALNQPGAPSVADDLHAVL